MSETVTTPKPLEVIIVEGAEKRGWNDALEEAMKVFSGDENWKLNIRNVLANLRKQ